MNAAYFIKEITVKDPDSKNPVEIAIYKHENGGMFGIDASYTTHVLDENEPIPDPFNNGDMVELNE